MLTLLRRSRKTKTINGTDAAGDDHRPARRCRRWRKPLLKLTSLITSQLSGAVWRPPAFPRVRFKRKTHTQHKNKQEPGRRWNFRLLLVNGHRSAVIVGKILVQTGVQICPFLVSFLLFLFRVRRGARGHACSGEVRGSQVWIGRRSSQHTHTIQSLKPPNVHVLCLWEETSENQRKTLKRRI